MRKTFDDMKWLKIALSVALLLWLCSLLISLTACAGLRPFPAHSLYEYDPRTPACAEYAITDPQALTFTWVRDIPAADCPAIFGFLDSEVGGVLKWGRDSIQYGKTHCK